MIDYVNTYLAQHKDGTIKTAVVPRLKCADGTQLSVQASSAHYCSPREDTGPWGAVEVWCISSPKGNPCYPRSFGKYEGDPYGWVPVSVVNAYIHRHGGLIR
jgi:hypothetical protein